MPEVAAPPAPPAAPATPPPPPPKPSTAPPIHVTEGAIDKGPVPAPPKPGSARDRMLTELRKKAGEEPETPPPVTPAQPKETPEEPGNTTPPAEAPEPSPVEPTATTPAEKKKLSPWKLVDEHKAARLKAETELAELRKTMAPPEKVKEIEEKYAAVEKRAKELEDHIKYVDYAKSQEFQEKYQKPYEAAWQRWMSDLGELMVQGENGQERPIAPQDLLDLVNTPLQKARAEAEAKFGDFADDVMSARKEIRGLFDAQNRALTEARTMGAKRIEEAQKQFQEKQEAIHKEVLTTWETSNKAVVTDEKYGKFFKPVEGDEEGNKRLQSGYEMADRAFASPNPHDPNLTAEQRAEVVRLHAAIRNRSAGFGRLAYQNQQLEAKVAELTAELAKYKSAEPGTDQPRQPAPAGPASARESVFDALRKYAH